MLKSTEADNDVQATTANAAPIDPKLSRSRRNYAALFGSARCVFRKATCFQEGSNDPADLTPYRRALMAARNGHLSLLAQLFKRENLTRHEMETIINRALRQGELATVQFLLMSKPYYMIIMGINLSTVASGNNALLAHMLTDYPGLRNPDETWQEAANLAVANGHGQMVDWLSAYQITPTAADLTAAAKSGQLHLLKKQHARHPLSDEILFSCADAALTAGHLSVVKWIKRSYPHFLIESPYNQISEASRRVNEAAHRGYLSSLKWLKENTRNSLPEVWSDGEAYIILSADKTAARAGQLHILSWLYSDTHRLAHESSCVLDAFKAGHLHIAKWLTYCVSQTMTAETISCWIIQTIEGGHLHLLFLLETFAHFPGYTIENANTAARHGHLAILKWLQERHDIQPDQTGPFPSPTAQKYDYNVNSYTFTRAIQTGNFYAIKALLANTPEQALHTEHAKIAIAAGQLKVLTWMHTQGCELTEELAIDAFAAKSLEITAFLASKNVPGAQGFFETLCQEFQASARGERAEGDYPPEFYLNGYTPNEKGLRKAIRDENWYVLNELIDHHAHHILSASNKPLPDDAQAASFELAKWTLMIACEYDKAAFISQASSQPWFQISNDMIEQALALKHWPTLGALSSLLEQEELTEQKQDDSDEQNPMSAQALEDRITALQKSQADDLTQEIARRTAAATADPVTQAIQAQLGKDSLDKKVAIRRLRQALTLEELPNFLAALTSPQQKYITKVITGLCDYGNQEKVTTRLSRFFGTSEWGIDRANQLWENVINVIKSPNDTAMYATLCSRVQAIRQGDAYNLQPNRNSSLAAKLNQAFDDDPSVDQTQAVAPTPAYATIG